MKLQHLVIALTITNLGLLAFLLTRARADNPAVLPVLRGSALEIVDGRGKVRAELRVFPADTKHMLPNGEPYPETVLLRLIDPNGRPSVKLATDIRGGKLYLGGSEDPTMTWVGAEGSAAELRLVNKDGTERKVRP